MKFDTFEKFTNIWLKLIKIFSALYFSLNKYLRVKNNKQKEGMLFGNTFLNLLFWNFNGKIFVEMIL